MTTLAAFIGRRELLPIAAVLGVLVGMALINSSSFVFNR